MLIRLEEFTKAIAKFKPWHLVKNSAWNYA